MANMNEKNSSFITGRLIDDSLMTDLISLLYQSRRQAKLHLEQATSQSKKRYPVDLYFMNGQVVYASSSNPYHRLGAILIRRGELGEFELSKVLSQLNGQRLGDALLARGVIAREQLISALKDQALIILQTALLNSNDVGNTDGLLDPFDYFEVSSFNETDIPLNLHIDAQGLLLEVFRQQDEVKSLLRTLPPLSECPIAQRLPQLSDKPEVAFALQQASGHTPLRMLLFMNPIGALDALKLYHDLLTTGDLMVSTPWEQQAVSKEVLSDHGASTGDEEGWFDLCFTPEVD